MLCHNVWYMLAAECRVSVLMVEGPMILGSIYSHHLR